MNWTNGLTPTAGGRTSSGEDPFRSHFAREKGPDMSEKEFSSGKGGIFYWICRPEPVDMSAEISRYIGRGQ